MGVNGLFAMAVVLGTIWPALSPSQKKIQTLKCPLSAQSKAVGNKNKRDFSSEIVTLEDLGLDLKRDFFFSTVCRKQRSSSLRKAAKRHIEYLPSPTRALRCSSIRKRSGRKPLSSEREMQIFNQPRKNGP